jgi:hypothetical protein
MPHCIAQFNAYVTKFHKSPDDRPGQFAGLFTLAQGLNSMTAYAQNKAAVEASNLLKNTYLTTFKGTQDYSAQILEFANANIKAAVEQSTKLSRAKSPTEFFALSNEYARQRFELFSQQAQELAAIFQKVTAATTETVAAGVRKAV